ncbi:flagellar basal-body rod protein FlgG [Noviherbaspirillum galbum]|uniref:Flagellar basal-body rod protein FlgG n=1 Tax=Noviherbaspirillum galbum TaxID=2709383 RepID=A0A6B3SR70_9BURK|nr:flagellar basal-body rod protein FlgG [Noviherbaspirillum galbum]NEX63018.1 flagellar basal-body rod protein FlgG [Noviherbaspirillum galbum]
MNDAIYIAATGMQMQQLNVDTIAGNLANVNTPNYRRSQVNFQELMARGIADATGADASQRAASVSRSNGVGLVSISRPLAAGELRKTDNPLDVAIRGDGFIEVEAPDGGVAYLRGGTLKVGKDGLLGTDAGMPLRPHVQVGQDAKDITIRADGAVLVRQSGQDQAYEVGRIELATFADAGGLDALGGNLYRATARSGEAIYARPGEETTASLAQGFLEASNVKLVDEMVNLMVAQRAYEINVKVIQASDDMLAMSNNLRR